MGRQQWNHKGAKIVMEGHNSRSRQNSQRPRQTESIPLSGNDFNALGYRSAKVVVERSTLPSRPKRDWSSQF